MRLNKKETRRGLQGEADAALRACIGTDDSRRRAELGSAVHQVRLSRP